MLEAIFCSIFIQNKEGNVKYFVIRRFSSCAFCLTLHFYSENQYDASVHSLDHRPPVVLEADLQLLEDLAALLQRRSVSVWEGHVVNREASLLVDVQQGGNPVLVKLSSGAEHKHFLHPLVLELLC